MTEINNKNIVNYSTFAKECALCQKCALCQTRKNVVVGRGNWETAQFLILGEAPGATEDEQGLPFVGRSGKLLASILKENSFTEEDYYITNIVKCRPPFNRKPTVKEQAACEEWLLTQLEHLPNLKCILTLGSTAYQWCQKDKTPMLQVRGNWQIWQPKKIPLLPTVHPSYILRFAKQRFLLAEDLKKVSDFILEQNKK